MNYFRRMLLLTIVFLTCGPAARSKCVTGNVNVSGRVDNLHGSEARAEVTLTLKKGKITETTVITDGQFAVDMPFSTFSSYFFLFGERCNNSPVSVAVKIVSADVVLGQENLKIKDSFRTADGLRYRLKSALVVRVETHTVAAADDRPEIELMLNIFMYGGPGRKAQERISVLLFTQFQDELLKWYPRIACCRQEKKERE